MDLLIYHFLRYDNETPFEYLIKNYSKHSYLCFDLEDSIQDILHPANTSSRKHKSRVSLNYLFRSNIDKMKDLNIAIRLNPLYSVEFQKDMAAIAKLDMNPNNLTLLLPKTESSNDISFLLEVLNNKHISFNEIIAIIENKKGMDNLPSILKLRSDKFNKIAYGHCDYNYSLGNFPFDHHDSGTYWNVVESMMISAESMGFAFINSPCLSLDNEDLFLSILKRLTGKTKSESIGQIVLTHKHASWCQSFIKSRNLDTPLLSDFSLTTANRNEKDFQYTNREYAIKLISDYEFNLNGKAFSITRPERVLISPSEYLAAKRYL
jgi:citrate lyase beta subunit